MNSSEYIRAKQDELKKWEHEIEAKGVKLTDALQAKRAEVLKQLDAVKNDTGERIDVLRMGFESAWEELKTSFKTVTSKDMNAKS